MNARTSPPASGEAAEVGSAEANGPAQGRRSRSRRIALMASLPLMLLVGGGALWLTGGRYVETENAYVTQTKALISPDVAGRIVEVDVHENQPVRKGDVLFRIDPDPYRIALASAEAALAAARLNVEQLKIGYLTAKAKLASAQDALDIRRRWLDRNGDLAARGYSSQANVDQLRLSYQQAKEAVTLARQEIETAKAALNGHPAQSIDKHPSVEAAKAKVEQARLDLDRTTVTAPADGIVSQTAKLNVGQYAAAGAAMLTLVETDNVWVEANLKETQLTHVAPGQHAQVGVDAYPDLALDGEVISIGAGTGSEFSLIPAQNATGNWVKVVQRLPVRLALKGEGTDRLRTGMSVSVSIDTGASRWQEYMK